MPGCFDGSPKERGRRGPRSHVADLAGLVPTSCHIVVRIVPYSSAECRALQDRIAGDSGALQAMGVELAGVAFDPIIDKVAVGVLSLTPHVQAELERRYPKDMISVTQQLPAVPAGSSGST